jgi:hypothetical protein
VPQERLRAGERVPFARIDLAQRFDDANGLQIRSGCSRPLTRSVPSAGF